MLRDKKKKRMSGAEDLTDSLLSEYGREQRALQRVFRSGRPDSRELAERRKRAIGDFVCEMLRLSGHQRRRRVPRRNEPEYYYSCPEFLIRAICDFVHDIAVIPVSTSIKADRSKKTSPHSAKL